MTEERSIILTAFVLTKTEIGSKFDVLRKLQKIEGAEAAHNLWGVYDIIANIKADTKEKLTFIINKKLKEIVKVNAKLTMVTAETETSPFLFAKAVVNG